MIILSVPLRIYLLATFLNSEACLKYLYFALTKNVGKSLRVKQDCTYQKVYHVFVEKIDRGIDPSVVRNFIIKDDFLSMSYKDIYTKFRSYIQSNNLDASKLKLLEIGGAGGTSDLVFPNIIKTDIIFSNDLNLVCDATKLPFGKSVFDLVILKDSLHHIPDLNAFFNEVERILAHSGIVLIADPNWNFLSQLLFKFFHPEIFDMKSDLWDIKSSNPWESNQATLYLLLKKQKSDFLSRFPNLLIKEIGFSSGLTYALSGGVYKRNKLSSNILIKLFKIESSFLKFYGHTALNKLIAIHKK
jgi:hypothetical protein